MISSKAKFAVANAALALFLSSKVSAQTGPAAETLYVIEHLVVSVNAAADGSGDRVGQIQSGDRVEVLERQDEQTRVRLTSGQEGWVRSSYLSANPPLREQLKTRGDELEKLKQEKTKLEGELASARKAAAAATAAAAASPATTPREPASPAPVPQASDPTTTSSVTVEPSSDPQPPVSADSAPSNPPIFSGEGVLPSRPSWVAAFIVSVVALAVGFALGWRVLDRRIRAKYGGLRIY